MAVREFDGTDDDIVRDIGALVNLEYGTFVFLLKRSASSLGAGFPSPLVLLDSDDNGHLQFYTDDDDEFAWWNQSTSEESRGPALDQSDRWYVVVARKETGSNSVRFSTRDMTAGTWSHGGGVGSVQDLTPVGAGGYVNSSFGGGTGFFEGRMAAVAAWSNTLPWSADASGDTAIENAGLETHLSNWFRTGPDAVWAFNQESTSDPVNDLTGNGADQTSVTGTTVVTDDDPPGFSFELEPVREFDGVDDDLIVSTPGVLAGFNYGTVGVLFKPLSFTDDNGLLNLHDNLDNWQGGIRTRSSNGDLSWYSASDHPFSGAPLSVGNWYLAVIRSDTVNDLSAISVYDFAAGTWGHDLDSSAPPQWGSVGAGGYIAFRRATGDDPPHIRIAVRAAWVNAIPWPADSSGNSAIEALGLETSLQNWVDQSPDSLWRFNQSRVYSEEVLTDSPLRYWKLSETSGGTVTDEVSSANGTVAGGTDLDVSGPANLGSAVDFDGADGRIEVSPVLTALPCTIEGWLNSTDSGTWGTIYAEADSAQSDRTVQLTVAGTNGGVIEASIRSDSAYPGSFVRGSTVVADGSWHHVVAVFTDAGSGNIDISLYVDGQPETSGTVTQGGGFPTGIDAGAMGWLPRSGPVDILDGSVDEVAVYDTALSQARISAHYDAQPIFVTDLTENGADQISVTGTSVVTNDPVPGFSYALTQESELTFLNPVTSGTRW